MRTLKLKIQLVGILSPPGVSPTQSWNFPSLVWGRRERSKQSEMVVTSDVIYKRKPLNIIFMHLPKPWGSATSSDIKGKILDIHIDIKILSKNPEVTEIERKWCDYNCKLSENTTPPNTCGDVFKISVFMRTPAFPKVGTDTGY